MIDKLGNYINKCLDFDKLSFKIVRSGNRNLHSASMASITLMKNPIKITDGSTQTGYLDQDVLIFDGSQTNPRIINASAVVYNDFWKPDYEKGLPGYPNALNSSTMNSNGLPIYPNMTIVNPFLWNIKGDWRAEKSYAYLTGRITSVGQTNNPRIEGFYKRFTPFYKLDGNRNWVVDESNWTYASSVSKYSPYGVELENKDALNRYSSAQYGYNYTLPMAVASNSKYEQIGFEGFEESDILNKHFGFDIDKNSISENQSHTGKKSIKVINGKKVKLINSLGGPVMETKKATCPIVPPTPTNCDPVLTEQDANCVSFNTEVDYFQTKILQLTFDSGLSIQSLDITTPDNQPSPQHPLIVNPATINGNILTFCVGGKFSTNNEQTEPSSLYNQIFVSVTFTNGTSCCVKLEVTGHVKLHFKKMGCTKK